MMPDGKTVGERILAHLDSLGLARLTESQTWPFGATQDGIAAAIGLQRAHVALEVARMRRKDRIERITAHVQGGRGRRYVYRPGREKPGRVLLGEIVRCPGCGQEIRIRVSEA